MDHSNVGSDICHIKLGFVQVNTKTARKMSDVLLLFHAQYILILTSSVATTIENTR